MKKFMKLVGQQADPNMTEAEAVATSLLLETQMRSYVSTPIKTDRSGNAAAFQNKTSVRFEIEVKDDDGTVVSKANF